MLYQTATYEQWLGREHVIYTEVKTTTVNDQQGHIKKIEYSRYSTPRHELLWPRYLKIDFGATVFSRTHSESTTSF